MTDDFSNRGSAERESSSDVHERQEERDDSGTPQADKASSRAKSPSEEGEERDDAPPLPDEEAPPLPDEEPPEEEPPEDDGWEARWDAGMNAYYFFNKFTLKSQWENPRIPQDSGGNNASRTESAGYSAPGTEGSSSIVRPTEAPPIAYHGYNPKIHGDYDPEADYAKFHEPASTSEEQYDPQGTGLTAEADGAFYDQAANFNRFTGSFQRQDRGSDYHNDESKSHRQMNAFFDVDRAANSHDGRSLKEERSKQKLSKKEVKEFNDKRRAKKEQKRREFLLS